MPTPKIELTWPPARPNLSYRNLIIVVTASMALTFFLCLCCAETIIWVGRGQMATGNHSSFVVTFKAVVGVLGVMVPVVAFWLWMLSLFHEWLIPPETAGPEGSPDV